MIVALLSLFVGGILVYAGVTGKSVSSLLLGGNQAQAENRSLGGSK